MDYSKSAKLSMNYELTLGDNHIRGLALTRLGCNPELVTLDVARNSLSEIPLGLSNALPNLVRLDLSNNNLNSVPTELGFLESLHVLTLTANPIKSITSGVISSGTQAVKSLLRSRHVPPPDGRELNGDTCGDNSKELVHLSKAGGDTSTAPDAVVERLPGVSPSGLLDWSGNNTGSVGGGGGGTRAMAGRGRLAGAQLRPPPSLPALNEVVAWQSAALPTASSNTSVREVRLVARQLDSFPLGLLAFESTLTSLNLSKNALRDLPSELTRFVRLEHLDLSSNLLQSLSSSLTALGTLQTLILDLNPSMGPELPTAVICQPPLSQSLQNLSARNCKLKRLPPASLLHPSNMPALQSLDVTDNDVDHLEPELGLCDQIRSLHLEGNAFRVPRPALVAKGTQAVLEYLRSRIVT
ncbi:Leucine-rich repeat-containing protein 40 [Sparganum proliferum]